MTAQQEKRLQEIIQMFTDVRPTRTFEDLFANEWHPFLSSLAEQDRSKAIWRFLEPQLHQFHQIVQHLQTLPDEDIQTLRPTLEKVVALEPQVRQLGQKPVTAQPMI